MNSLVFERAGAVLAIVFGVRVWFKWRLTRREQSALMTPLVDSALLEAVFVPRIKDGDDSALLAEMHDTFLHLNRRAYAEEFWGLHTQLVSLYKSLDDAQRATMRRAFVRLITANDRWVQLVGAKTASELSMKEAIPPLIAVLEMGDSQRFHRDKVEYSTSEAVDLRYRQELELALAALTDTTTRQE